MRPSDVEEWAQRVIAALQDGRALEDSRVELKSGWPEPEKAARRIAGHANAACGEDILWLVGVTEDGALPGLDAKDLASWWPRVKAHMRPPVPEVQPVTVCFNSQLAVALLIDSSRAPYLVKNPRYGSPEGGPVEFEVPWREMTSVRTARHEDLIRILVPLARLPTVEVLSADLQAQSIPIPDRLSVRRPTRGEPTGWTLTSVLYIVPRQKDPVVLPAHTIRTFCAGEGFGDAELEIRQRGPRRALSAPEDLILEHPVRVEYVAQLKAVASPSAESVEVRIVLGIAGDSRELHTSASLRRNGEWLYSLAHSHTTLQG